MTGRSSAALGFAIVTRLDEDPPGVGLLLLETEGSGIIASGVHAGHRPAAQKLSIGQALELGAALMCAARADEVEGPWWENGPVKQ